MTQQLKTFSEILSELAMKSDKKLPNLKIPVKGKKGTSKYMRMKVSTTNAPYTSDYKKAMAASYDPSGVNEGPPGTQRMSPKDAASSPKSVELMVKSRTKNLNQLVPPPTGRVPAPPKSSKLTFQKSVEAVQSADKKPEKYVKADGKVGIRMVKTDKEVIKKEGAFWGQDKMAKQYTDDIKKRGKVQVSKMVGKARHTIIIHKKDVDKHKKKGWDLHPDFKEDVKEWAPVVGAALRAAPKIASAVGRMAPSASLGAAASMAKDKASSAVDKLKKTYSNRKVMGVKAKQNELYAQKMNPTDHVKEKDGKFCVYNVKGEVVKEFDTKKAADMYATANHDKLMAEGKAYGPTGISYHVPTGHKDEVDPKTKEKYPERQKPGYKAPSPKKTKTNEIAPVIGALARTAVTTAVANKLTSKKKTNEEVDVDEALNMQQRMARKRLMKRYKSRIAIGKKRAARKMANKKTLEKRSMRQARNQLAKKLTRGIPKKELSFARKQEIEKRLDKPSMQTRIKRMARKMFKDVRKKEVERKKG